MLYHIFYRDVWCVSTHHNKSQLQSLSEPGIMFPSLLEITNWYKHQKYGSERRSANTIVVHHMFFLGERAVPLPFPPFRCRCRCAQQLMTFLHSQVNLFRFRMGINWLRHPSSTKQTGIIQNTTAVLRSKLEVPICKVDW